MEYTISPLSPNLGQISKTLRSNTISKLTIDLSSATFFTPSELAKWRCAIDIALDLAISCSIFVPRDQNVKNYVGRMGLFEGTNYAYPFQMHTPRNFLPLVRISSDNNSALMENLSGLIENQFNPVVGYTNRVVEGFSELASNIYWHSGAAKASGIGYFSAQSLKGSNPKLLIAVCDLGVGFYGSFQRENFTKGRGELEILLSSFKEGESSLKKDDPHRGIGLYTVVEELIKQYSGRILLRSGHHFVNISRNQVSSGKLPQEFVGSLIEIEVPILC